MAPRFHFPLDCKRWVFSSCDDAQPLDVPERRNIPPRFFLFEQFYQLNLHKNCWFDTTIYSVYRCFIHEFYFLNLWFSTFLNIVNTNSYLLAGSLGTIIPLLKTSNTMRYHISLDVRHYTQSCNLFICVFLQVVVILILHYLFRVLKCCFFGR